MYSSTYNSPSDNYGSAIGIKPFGGPVARSLTAARVAPAGMGGTGNATQDAMRRAQFDLSRNLMQTGRQQFENKYQSDAVRARAEDVFNLRSSLGRQYELDTRGKIDNANRSLQLSQNLERIRQNLASASNVNRWAAIADYTQLAMHPTVLGSKSGVAWHLMAPPTVPESIRR